MSKQEWGLTEKGFCRPTYSELLDALEYQAREQFGSKANLTVRSPLGIFLRIFAWMLNLLFGLIEDVYNSRFVDTAVGNSLYNLGRAIGLTLLPARKATGYIEIEGPPGHTVPKGYLVSTIADLHYVVVANSVIGIEGKVLAPIQATVAGPHYNTGANTVKHIVNPDGIIKSVTNPKAVDGGRDRETDAEYRARYHVSVDFSGGVNTDGIKAEILQSVEGIQAAIVYENDSDVTNEMGLPPHSVEAVVYGGFDADVAKAIHRRKSAGIQPFGNTMVPVIDASGNTKQIHFSRPEGVQVWVKVSNLMISASFPQNGKELIQEAIVAYIGGDNNSGVGIGEHLVYVKLPCVILGAAEGIVDFDLAISQDGVSFGTQNIEVEKRQKVITDRRQVSVI